MPEITFTNEEIRAFISEYIPSFQREIIIKLIEDTAAGQSTVDLIGEKLTGELDENSMIIAVGSRRKKESYWINVKKEVYKYICTDAEEYSKERSTMGNSFESLVTALAGIIGAQMDIATGILTSLIAVTLIGIAKIGKNAWCETNIHLKAKSE